MEELRVDLAVIGAGPAGQKAAIQAAKLGKEVVIIDRGARLGGACLHHGTIPSKTLREAVLDLTGFRERSFYGRRSNLESISIHDLNYRLDTVLDQLSLVVEAQIERNGIRILRGNARFSAVDLLEVRDRDGQLGHRVHARRIIIATGSSPRCPDGIPFDDDCILDSDRLLRLDSLPSSMVVLGGGIIGSEYATMMATLGVRVTVVDKAERPLRTIDDEIAERFVEFVHEEGVTLRFGKNVEKIERTQAGRARITFGDGETVEADCALCTMGRIANVTELNLDKIGLELTERGVLPVNSLFQTAWPNIYAAGDVAGGPLASTAMEQGRLAARNAFAERSLPFPEVVPFGIYTIPEISYIGPTEQDLKKSGVHYGVGRAWYSEIARGSLSGDRLGFMKLIFHEETHEVLAAHVIGTCATELIHVAQAAIHFNAKLEFFVNEVFNYPTFAEGFRIAAFDGLNAKKKPAAVAAV